MKSYKTYYNHQRDLNLPCVKNYDDEWWVAKDIQRCIVEKYRAYVSLSKIGKIAKMLNKKMKTSYGFNLYHRSLVDDIGEHTAKQKFEDENN